MYFILTSNSNAQFNKLCTTSEEVIQDLPNSTSIYCHIVSDTPVSLIQEIFDALNTNTSVESIHISVTQKYSVTNAKLIADILTKFMQTNKSIKNLKYAGNLVENNCYIADALISHVQLNTSLESLTVIGAIFNETQFISLSKAIAQSQSLRKLALIASNIDTESLSHIALAVERSTNLRNVNLYDNNLDNHGIAIIAELITKNAKLENVYLPKIKGDSINLLASAAIQRYNTLIHLQFSTNTPLLDKNAKHVLQAILNGTVTESMQKWLLEKNNMQRLANLLDLFKSHEIATSKNVQNFLQSNVKDYDVKLGFRGQTSSDSNQIFELAL